MSFEQPPLPDKAMTKYERQQFLMKLVDREDYACIEAGYEVDLWDSEVFLVDAIARVRGLK